MILRIRGAALITVMIVVFIVMAIIANLTVTDYRTMKRLANRQLIEQASAITYSAIDFGRAGLATSGATSNIDTLRDVWAQPLPKTKLMDNIYMSGYLVDEQSKFNINDLVSNGQVNQTVLNQFTQLLSYINLPQSLANSIAYYMAAPQYQSDIQQQYTGGKPPYRPAGRPIVDIAELVLVKGITPPMVNKLAQYITAVPISGIESENESSNNSQNKAIATQGSGLSVNINTASAEVIAAKSGIDLSVAQRILSYRTNKSFESQNAITSFLMQNGISTTKNNGQQLNLGGLGVNSSYFTVHAIVDDQDDQFRWVAYVYRQNRSGQWPQILWQHPE